MSSNAAPPRNSAVRPRSSRPIALGLACTLCAIAIAAIAALLSGGVGQTDADVLLSALGVAVASLTGLAGAAAADRPGARILGRATIGLSATALALVLALIWLPDAVDEHWLGRSFLSVLALTLAGAHASLMLTRLRDGDKPLIRILTGAAIANWSAGALTVSILALGAHGEPSGGIWRLLGVLAILALLATLLAPLARRIVGGAPGDDQPSADGDPHRLGVGLEPPVRRGPRRMLLGWETAGR